GALNGVMALGWFPEQEFGQVPAQHLGAAPPEHILRSMVPVSDALRQVTNKNGIGRLIQQRGLFTDSNLGFLDVVDVSTGSEPLDHLLVGIPEWRAADQPPAIGAIRTPD